MASPFSRLLSKMYTELFYKFKFLVAHYLYLSGSCSYLRSFQVSTWTKNFQKILLQLTSFHLWTLIYISSIHKYCSYLNAIEEVILRIRQVGNRALSISTARLLKKKISLSRLTKHIIIQLRRTLFTLVLLPQ